MTEGWSAETLEGNCTQLANLKQTAKIRVGENNTITDKTTKVVITNLLLT